jgi:hypothetical protein
LDLSARGCESGLDFKRRAAPGWQCPLGRDPAAGHEEGPHVGTLAGRDEDAALEPPHAVKAPQFAANSLQSSDPVAQSRRVLEAASLCELAEPSVQAW